jgi:hypothetical protein
MWPWPGLVVVACSPARPPPPPTHIRNALPPSVFLLQHRHAPPHPLSKLQASADESGSLVVWRRQRQALVASEALQAATRGAAGVGVVPSGAAAAGTAIAAPSVFPDGDDGDDGEDGEDGEDGAERGLGHTHGEGSALDASAVEVEQEVVDVDAEEGDGDPDTSMMAH